MGIQPGADQPAIRSAYRALMRRFHPDADPSAEAAEQARAINVAYAVLGDPAKRAAYNGTSASKSSLSFEPFDPPKTDVRWSTRIGASAAVIVALLAAGMVAYAVLPRASPEPPLRQVEQRKPIPVPDRKSPAAARPAVSATSPSAPAALVRTEVAKPHSDKIAPVSAEAVTPAKPVAAQVKSAGAQANSQSDRCAGSAARADRLICGDENLASLDRQLTLLYRQSWSAADQRKRAALAGTRQIFDDKREECETSNCLTSAYVGRLREISDIMAGRPLQ